MIKKHEPASLRNPKKRSRGIEIGLAQGLGSLRFASCLRLGGLLRFSYCPLSHFPARRNPLHPPPPRHPSTGLPWKSKPGKPGMDGAGAWSTSTGGGCPPPAPRACRTRLRRRRGPQQRRADDLFARRDMDGIPQRNPAKAAKAPPKISKRCKLRSSFDEMRDLSSPTS